MHLGLASLTASPELQIEGLQEAGDSSGELFGKAWGHELPLGPIPTGL